MGSIRRRLLLSLLGCCAALAIAAPAAQATLTWTNTTYDFGGQHPGTAAPAKTFTLIATCDADLGFPSFVCIVPAHAFGLPAVTGEGFSLGSPNTCVAAVLVTPFGNTGPATCVTTVNFTPSSPGAKTGSLNLPTGPDIALTGNGVAVCKKGQKLKNGKCVKKKKKKKH